MQWSVTVVVEIAPEAEIGQMEQAVLEVGRQAMREALKQAVRASEDGHAACPGCGSASSRSQGTVARRVLTRFGRVVVRMRRQRCASCGRRFRPAQGYLAVLAGGNVTPELGRRARWRGQVGPMQPLILCLPWLPAARRRCILV